MKIPSRYPKVALLFMARSVGLFALARTLTRHDLRILCYHGGAIGDEPGYNPKLFCSAATLRARMAWMRKQGFRMLTLDEAVGRSGTVPATTGLAVAITFDDGWYSSVSELVPVLAEMGMPSTLYVSTEQYLKGGPVLGVTLRYMLWKAGVAFVTLDGHGEADGHYDLHREGSASHLVNAVARHIGQTTGTRDEVCAALERFGACIGLDSADLRLDTRRFDYVTADELAYLPASGCQVELHGHVHRYPNGNPRAFADDLQSCDDAIVAAGLPLPRHYCYPSGSFDDAAAKVLERMGIRSATTCLSGLARKGVSRYYLPRFLDGEDVHAIEFEAEMSGLLDLARRGLAMVRRAFSGVRPGWSAYADIEESTVPKGESVAVPVVLTSNGILPAADQSRAARSL